MIFGVDGTGPFWNDEYTIAMAGSFVSQLCSPKSATKMYWRGPDNLDTIGSGPSPRTVADTIRAKVAPAPKVSVYPGLIMPTIVTSPGVGPSLPVFLTGYSRGGATVIDVATILKGYGIPVEAMFLFDAVARSAWLSGKVIPSNVRNCYHAIRDPKSKSRESFGNCGLLAEPGVNFPKPVSFNTTHGGMGGCPWGPSGLVKPAKVEWNPFDQPLGPIGGMGFFSPPIMTPQQIAEQMVRDNPARWGDKIYEGFPDGFTAVTVEQEKLEMANVRHWMWGFVRQHNAA